MYEVRCKVQKSSNLKSSAWLTSNNDWPPEIDLFEYKTENKKSFFSTVHWLPGGSGNACQNFYEYPYDIGDDFHTWTVVWTPEEVSWFFDGVLLKTDDRAAHIPGTTRPNEWELCRWDKMDLILNGRVTSPTSSFDDLIVDYVKFYKPQSLSPFTGSNGVQFTTYYNNHLVPTYANTSYMPSSDWNMDFYKTDLYYDYQAYSDLNVVQNGGKFIYKGNFNLLWQTYYSGGTYYSSPLSWSKTVTGDVTTALNGNVIYYRKGNQLRYYQNGNFLPAFATNISKEIIANTDGKEVYYIGTDNYLWHAKRSSTSSNTWTKKRTTTAVSVAGGLTFHPTNFNKVVFRTPSNKIGQITKSGTFWSYTAVGNHADATDDITVNSTGNIFYRNNQNKLYQYYGCLLYTSPSPRDRQKSRMPSSA